MSEYVCGPGLIFGRSALWLGSHLSQGGGGVKIERNGEAFASQIISTYRLCGSALVPTVFSESLFNGPADEKNQQEIKERNLLMASF